jgi:hypothetical protein
MYKRIGWADREQMVGVNTQLRALSTVHTVAAALVVSVLVLFIFPIAAHAEDTPPAVTQQAPASTPMPVPTKDGNIPNEAVPNQVYVPNESVQAPGTPAATTPTDVKDIVWEWTPPENGTTPDAPVVPPADPTETPEIVEPPVVVTPVPHATDITHYGYELSADGTVILTGTVESTENKVTTKVDKRGTYSFRLWSITRDAQISDSIFANQTVVNPPIPYYPPVVVPAALDTRPIDNIPSSTDTSVAVNNTLFYNGRNQPITNSDVASANVFGDTNTGDANKTPSPQSDVATVVKASNQGWIIAGLNWYIWILVAAIIFTSWRWYRNYAKSRE